MPRAGMGIDTPTRTLISRLRQVQSADLGHYPLDERASRRMALTKATPNRTRLPDEPSGLPRDRCAQGRHDLPRWVASRAGSGLRWGPRRADLVAACQSPSVGYLAG